MTKSATIKKMDILAKKVISQVFIEDFILFPCEVGRYQHKHKTFVCFKADAQIIDIKWKKEKHLLCRCSIYVNIVHINNSCVSYSSTVF